MPPELIPAALAAGGVAAVLVGALLFRLHALFALTLAGLAVMWLTPRENVVRAEVEATAVRFVPRAVGEPADLLSPRQVSVDRYGTLVRPDEPRAFRPAVGGGLGEPVAQLSPARRPFHQMLAPPGVDEFAWEVRGSGGFLIVKPQDPPWIDGERLVRLPSGDYEVRPHTPVRTFGSPPPKPSAGRLRPGDLIVGPDDLAAADAVADRPPPVRFAAAFGQTAAGIGLLIAFASVLGAALLHAGAAERLVRALLGVVGPRGHPAAFCAGGFLLGIPVFFDAVFLLCAPLCRSTALKTGGNYPLLLAAVICGGALTHSLVPPTPGPLLVAAELGVGVPAMLAAGLFVSAAAAPPGLLFSWWWTRRMTVPVRDSAGASLDRLRALGERPPTALPPLWASAAPLAVPVFLIAQAAAWEAVGDRLAGAGWDWPKRIVAAAGEPTVAVLCGTLLALALLSRRASRAERREVVGAAVAEGGGILLVAAAGGAFGAALRQTGVGGLIAALPDVGSAGVLTLAWLAAAAMRTAQGSSTVAMVVAAGLVGGLDAGVDPVWTACAIGGGSKAVAWMNASGFWVVGRAGGLTERETLTLFTPLTLVLAVAGLLATLAGAWLWPGG